MSPIRRDRGELAILLHSHMPYVEGFGTWPFGEEWLFEAMASCYLPLLECCERWAQLGNRGVLTIGVTPVLADQLVLPEVAERLLRFLYETRADCHRRDTEGLERAGQIEAAEALRRSALDYERAAGYFESLDQDAIGALCRMRDAGAIDLWTSAATHAVLPLVATEPGLDLQVRTGTESHRTRFGRWSGGFWLPECAFRAGIEDLLAAAGVRAFCIDQTSVGDALDQLEPVAGKGAVALPIDWQTISLVWDPGGYPADPLYRDYHALTLNGLRARANSGATYAAEAATERAREHARDFVGSVVERLDRYRAQRGRPGLLVFALDTELLGHWWYEGPIWLSAVVEEANRAGLALATVPEALERHEPRRRTLHDSSWGVGKDLSTWDAPEVADVVWRVRRAELALTGSLRPSRDGPLPPCAERAARELLALQSSDWAFMARRGLAGEYPHRRVLAHAAEFERALASVRRAVTDSRPMRARDGTDPRLRGLAPDLRLSSLLQPTATRERRDLRRPRPDE